MSIFKLKSPFKPAGDQPQAIEKLTRGVKKGYKYQTLLGVTGSGKTFTMANVIQNIDRPTLVISHNKTLAAQLASEFQEFFPEAAVHYFVSYYDYYQPEAYIPQSDTYIAKESNINEEIDKLRHAATSALLTRQDVIIVASVSCIYGLGSPQEYKDQAVALKIKTRMNRQEVLRELTRIQYSRNDLGFTRGTFRVRGDTLEIFPASEDKKIMRVEFFGDLIENISSVNRLTGKKIQSISEIEIFPARHWITPLQGINNFLVQVKKELKEQIKFFQKENKPLEAERIEQRTRYDLEMMREVGYCNGIENYSRYLDNRAPGEPPSTLIDFFPRNFLLFIDESHMTIPQIGGMYFGDKSRKKMLIEYGFRLPSALDNRPLKFAEFEKKVRQSILVSATPGPYEIQNSKQIVEQLVRPTGLLDPAIEVRPIENQIDDLINEIKKRIAKKQRILVTTLTKRMAEELAQYLEGVNLRVHHLHSEIDTMERLDILKKLRQGIYDVIVGINLLREGLDLPEVSLVAILDADKEGYLRSETALIQTMGRAARHIDGKVLMYADKMTGSMRRAISEVSRRRKVQVAYNQKHKITPRGIQKKIKDFLPTQEIQKTKKEALDLQNIPPEELAYLIHELEDEMELAAKNLEFEKAAKLRDQIKQLKHKK
ncbi:MAG: excinuclease ABC subunit UvrB [Patescibacteria group bacterium]|nr:excinuclease ABC subunit UvrB [Patescibacteria group bacterium]